MLKFLKILAIGVLLTSCTNHRAEQAGGFLYQSVTKGSVIRINSDLTIPAGQARAAIQHGKQVSEQELDKWTPYCEILVRTVAERDTSLPPSDYRVRRIQFEQDPYSQKTPESGQMIATAGNSALATGVAFGGPAYTWLFKIYMYLESAANPDVLRLECGQVWPSYAESRRMYLDEFEQAVGDIVSLLSPDAAH